MIFRVSAILALLCAPAVAQEAPTATAAAAPGRVAGRVELALPGVRLEDVGPLIVFLDAVDGHLAGAPSDVPQIRQSHARFQPSFLVIAVGQTVEMPNDDAIVHNVFSYSRPNEFDLGTYPGGQSRSVTFRHPGLVRVYCSIHASMNAMIFVTPTRYAARVAPDGSFEIAGVPPGRSVLKAWNEMLGLRPGGPEPAVVADVRPGEVARVTLSIGERAK